MKYNKLNKFQEHRQNPFLEDTFKQVHDHTRKKRAFIKGKQSIKNYIVDEFGSYIGESAFIQYFEVDDDQFVKIYVKEFSAFYDLSIPARKVLGYILSKCLIPNRDVLFIDFDEAKSVTQYSSDNSIRSGIADLINHRFLARSHSPSKYFINPTIFFNGDRISFIKTYIKKSKSNEL